MSDRVQIGVEVDRAVWERFREDVRERHGKVRGVLGDEVETALRERLGEETTPGIERLDRRLERIEQSVGTTATDGGTPTDADDADTHTPARLDTTEKPAANAATERKVTYLAACLEADLGADFAEVAHEKLVDTVKTEYGFRSDTAKRYVERLVEHFDLRDHPVADGILVTEDRYADLVEQRREELRDEVSDGA